MRLLYLLTDSFGIGGVQSDILTLTRELTRRGHSVYVASASGPLLQELTAAGARHFEVDFHFREPAGFWRGARRLRDIVRREEIEVLAPQSLRSALVSFTALRAFPFGYRVRATGTRVPIVVTVHNVHSAIHYRYGGRVLDRCADFTIFESHYERDRLVASGLRPEKSTVIHSGIDTERFAPRARDPELSSRYGLDPGEHRVFGIVARLSEEKGHRLLIEALHRLRDTVPQARLLVVGDGPLLAEVEAQVRMLRLEGRVIFTGTQRDIPAHLALIDVFVLSSTRESFPLAAREAMAAGRAVIAPRIGGCPEVVEDGVTGFLFEAGNVDDLADKMRRAIDGAVYPRQGAEARKRVERLFSRREWVAGDEAVYLRFARRRTASQG
jgi:glycosyltransferase involved in cell wall biosynthesis